MGIGKGFLFLRRVRFHNTPVSKDMANPDPHLDDDAVSLSTWQVLMR